MYLNHLQLLDDYRQYFVLCLVHGTDPDSMEQYKIRWQQISGVELGRPQRSDDREEQDDRPNRSQDRRYQHHSRR